MTAEAEKIAAEILALPTQVRAYLAHELLSSFDTVADADAEAEWMSVVDRRSAEIESGQVQCRAVADVVKDIRAKLNAQGR